MRVHDWLRILSSRMFSQEVTRLRNTFNSGKTKSISWRKNQLRSFLHMLKKNRDKFCQAMWEDLHKNPIEGELMEFMQVQNEVVDMLEHLDERSKTEKCKKSMMSILNTLCVRKEPLGLVLIMGAWNYPVILPLQPMVDAIAAGNCVIVKPSEISAATAKVIQDLIPKYLDNDCYTVIVGGPKESNDLITNNRFDLILYTGGSFVGKLVMQAAAKYLTPVILELGGKSPCYIDKSCCLDSTARRLAWGKWTNAGQICVAPDFALCEESMKAPLIAKLKECIKEYYGEDPKQSASYGRIVNLRHLNRLKSLLEGVEVVHGGIVNEEDRYFSPTIVTDISEDALIRQEEIFGPILPIFVVKDLDEAIEFMRSGGKSLQLSIFAKDRTVIDRVLHETSSGGVTVNDVLMQHNELDLPFGGVGDSGMGYYHGSYSYDSFCHKRGYFESGTPEFAVKSRYPPYSDSKMSLLKPLVYAKRRFFNVSKEFARMMFIALVGVLVGFALYKRN